jgi:hypothetical protein
MFCLARRHHIENEPEASATEFRLLGKPAKSDSQELEVVVILFMPTAEPSRQSSGEK